MLPAPYSAIEDQGHVPTSIGSKSVPILGRGDVVGGKLERLGLRAYKMLSGQGAGIYQLKHSSFYSSFADELTKIAQHAPVPGTPEDREHTWYHLMRTLMSGDFLPAQGPTSHEEMEHNLMYGTEYGQNQSAQNLQQQTSNQLMADRQLSNTLAYQGQGLPTYSY